MDFIKDFWAFLKERKKWWLAPILVMLLGIGAIVVFSGGTAISPFIYTLF
jgi:hypothetical protein